MQRVSFWALLLFLWLPTGFADLWNSNEKTPVQVYQEWQGPANSGDSGQAASSTTSQAAPSEQSASNPAYASTPPASPSDVMHLIELLKSELMQINQNAVLFQQTTNTKLEDLRKQLLTTDKRLKQLAQAFILLNKEVIALKSGNISGMANSPNFFSKHWPWIATISLVIVIALLLLLWLMRRHKQPVTQKKKVTANDTQSEYDYLGSNESIPAKLNLARAYVAMEDYAAAQKIIDEILLLGNEQQRREAAELAKQFPT